MRIAARNTGIGVLGDVPWGTHFCVFHETTQDLLDIAVPYFKAGLEHGEFCLWITPATLSKEEALGALRQTIAELDRHLAAESIKLVSYDEWFFEPEAFQLDRAIRRFADESHQALSRGYTGMRVNGFGAWLLEKKNTKQFSDYEKELDGLIDDHPMIVMCTFPLIETSAEEIVDMVHTHQFAVVRRKGAWETVKAGEAPIGPHSLTPREREVLGWVAQGKSTREISKILGIASRTVDEHVKAAARKLGAANRAHAVAIALREGFVKV